MGGSDYSSWLIIIGAIDALDKLDKLDGIDELMQLNNIMACGFENDFNYGEKE